jgi:hypothetical protein
VSAAVAIRGQDARLADALARALVAAGIDAVPGEGVGAAVVVWIAPALDSTLTAAGLHLALMPAGAAAPAGMERFDLPVRLPELIARVARGLSHRGPDGWRLDLDARCLRSPNGLSLRLTEIEARLVALLVDGAAHSQEALIAAGWAGRRILPATLATHVHRLRRKLEDASGPRLVSHPRGGYQLLAPAAAGV